MTYNSNGKVVRMSSQIGSARYTVPSRSDAGLVYERGQITARQTVPRVEQLDRVEHDSIPFDVVGERLCRGVAARRQGRKRHLGSVR